VQDLIDRIERRVNGLPAGLRDHIYRVREIACELARCHGIDEERAALGVLAHDVARAMPDEELLSRAAALDLPMGTVERAVPLLLHGPVGAELLAREDGLTDPSLHQAVYWHTTAHPSLDDLGKVVFLADKLDPQKIGVYPYLPQLRELALQDLDRAMLDFLTRETVSLASQGLLVHPMVIEARNHLLAASASAGISPVRT
jgi:predicted HD superfamily hydrolase involved in NAD metabolism